MSNHAGEIAEGKRFAFGENWRHFLELLDETRIANAEESLRKLLRRDSLAGLTFLDVGSGSGLFSLSALRIGATRVHSFDYDPNSVECTLELKNRYFPDDTRWSIEEGSVLDENYLSRLGQFDVVYSWGVLHHTGNMWKALENMATLVVDNGILVVAIYNDQGKWSKLWAIIKKIYNLNGPICKKIILASVISFVVAKGMLSDLLFFKNPLARYKQINYGRGMSVVRDWVDWVGGYPFEVAKPEDIFDFFNDRGFSLEKLTTVGGAMGCNEFTFRNQKSAD